MKRNTILMWTAGAIVYLGLVIGIYSIYASMNPTLPEEQHQREEINGHGGGHGYLPFREPVAGTV